MGYEIHTVDFTGTNGYAQTTIGYVLKTTTFKVVPRIDSAIQPNILNFYIGFTTDPSNIQYHSKKPADSVEFHMWSVNSNNATYGGVITNKNCLATPSEYFIGRACTYQLHNHYGYTNNDYTNNPIIINFVQAIGSDGKLHWYMQTSISNLRIIGMGNLENDKYLQFDDIIDNPIYFRMGTNNTAIDGFGMYCKSEGDVITDTPLFSDIADTNFTIKYDSGAVIDGVKYTNGDILDIIGEHFIEYIANGIAHSRRFVIYKTVDVKTDNKIDICDLVALKKKIGRNI